MGKKKILIIDDNSMIRALFADVFEDEFNVEMAVDGTQGIMAASATRPDVILLDVDMPDMSGVEVARQLSQLPETSAIPVIVVTATEYTDEIKRQFMPYGNFKGFLSKITSSADIRTVIKRVSG
ncbi:MAG TPA: two-component system response regulator [Elusimicrobia bacterium]|nr:two-component system response regulator [Elusimicrobiota bacterium]